jgi:DNA polymerase eta
MGTLQWKSIIALNYAAKDKGVKRGMLAHEALDVCPNMMFVHVSTIIDKDGRDIVLDSSICNVTKIHNNEKDSIKWKVETRD